MANRFSSLPNRPEFRIEQKPANQYFPSIQPNEVKPSRATSLSSNAVSAAKSPRLLEKRLRRGRRFF